MRCASSTVVDGERRECDRDAGHPGDHEEVSFETDGSPSDGYFRTTTWPRCARPCVGCREKGDLLSSLSARREAR